VAEAVRAPGDAAHGWRSLARGDFEVRRVAGTHVEMMRPPLVEDIARQLREAIGQPG
jgi:thioesterase domain-containing protein